MKILLATTRLWLTVAAGYAFVWGFGPEDPEWASSGRPIESAWRLPAISAPQFDLPEMSLPEVNLTRMTEGLSRPAQASTASNTVLDGAEVVRIAPPFSGLELPDSAFELARAADPLRLEPEPHPEGGWVIGYGRHVVLRPDEAVTREQAEAWLREDFADAELAVREAVQVSLSEEEYAALVEFARSIGAEQIDRTLVVILLNQGNREMAADAFMVWTNEEVDGVLVQDPELVAQRERTRELFLSGLVQS
ncbi:MAG: lysozyme [Maricaulaceae bacterium]|jgi:lysozyme